MSADKRLFALDENFPMPIVSALCTYVARATFTSLRDVKPSCLNIDDWEVLRNLHNHNEI